MRRTLLKIGHISREHVNQYGIYLNGTYSGNAAFVGGGTSNTNGITPDQGQVMISPTGGANRLQIGYVFNTGVTEYRRIQSGNESSDTPLQINQGGGVVLFGPSGVQLSATTVVALGTQDKWKR